MSVSFVNETAPVLDETVAVAEALTYASPPIDPSQGIGMGLHFYPFSNDYNLGIAYPALLRSREASGSLVPPAGTTYATLIVGNGSFEAAVEHIPERDLVLFCDSNPATLFVQRLIIETIKGAADLDEFNESIRQVISGIPDLVFGRDAGVKTTADVAQKFIDSYFERASDWDGSWQKGGPDSRAQPFFTRNNGAFLRAKAGIMNRVFAFYLVDISSDTSLEAFGEVLQENGVVIAGANMTNVLDAGYAAHSSQSLQQCLPWHPDAHVLETSVNNFRSRLRPLGALGRSVVSTAINW